MVRQRRVSCVSLGLLLSVVSWASAAETVGGTYDQWLRHRDARILDREVLGYYTFENLRDAKSPCPNLASGCNDSIAFQMQQVAGAPADRFATTEGRWPAKRAVRLDQGFWTGKAPLLPANQFSATMWFRKRGQGSHRGNAGQTNGMLLAVGNGYWDGWRVTTEYPSGRIGFEIGRPKPLSSVGINTAKVADDAWHYLAATWDGREMRLYVDAVLAAVGPFEGIYTAPVDGGELRVGYAGSGVGSTLLDVDEVTIWRRALTPADILQEVYFYAGFSHDQFDKWRMAEEAFAIHGLEKAEQLFDALLKSTPPSPDPVAAIQLRLTEIRMQQGEIDSATAAAQFLQLSKIPAIPDRLAREAESQLLELIRAGVLLPPELYAEMPRLAGASDNDLWTLKIQAGHAAAANGDYAAAREQYEKLVGVQNIPAAWRNAALLSMGRACVLSGDYAAAKVALTRVNAVQGEPRYRLVEVAERLHEINRLALGMTARDPVESRVKIRDAPRPSILLYVAPGGRDENSGTQASPFATLTRARDEIRKIRKTAQPAGAIAVILRGGRYAVRETFRLAREDSGTAELPIVYRAMENEIPVLDAGQNVSGFEVVRDPAVLKRLSADIAGKVYQTNLKAQGVESLGLYEPGGFASARGNKLHPQLQLFFNGTAMPLSRWPDEGFVHIASSPASANDQFSFSEDRAARWKGEKDAWLYGYWFYDWADSYEKIGSIDFSRKSIKLAAPSTHYGDNGHFLKAGQRYYALNMLCELDSPGEWYLDRDSGILYFYPPNDLAKANVQVSVFDKPVVEFEDVSNVRLQGLTWENGRGDGIEITGGGSCLLLGCAIRQFAGTGIVINGGTQHGVVSCDLHDLGRGGMIVNGGDRKTLASAGHFVENCVINRFSEIDHTYAPAVLLSGVGNRVAHCVMHGSPSSAMRIEGNDHLIEFNEVYDVVRESDDQGGSDSWGDPTYRGNVFRYNDWHDIGNGLAAGQAGIRLDDFISGVEIYGNVFRRCAESNFGAIQMNGGKDNCIENNLFIDCRAAVSGGSGDLARWKKFLESPAGLERVGGIKPSEPPYSIRYPEVQNLLTNLQDSVSRNVAVRCGRFVLHDQRLDLRDNWSTSGEVGLKELANGQLPTVKDAPLWRRPGFEPIPFEEIGLYVDQYRTTLR